MGLQTTIPESEKVTHQQFRDNLVTPGQPNTQQGSTKPNEPKPKLEEYDVTKMSQEDPSLLTLEWDTDTTKGPYDDILKGKTEEKTVPPPIGGQTPGAPPTFVPYNKEKFRNGVKVLILIIDFLMSNLFKFIAKARNAGTYSADKEQKSILEDSILDLMDDSKVKLPPWVVCLFAFLGAYAIQAFAAFGDRKKNLEDQERIANLEHANEVLRQKREQEKTKGNQSTQPANAPSGQPATNTSQPATPANPAPASTPSTPLTPSIHPDSGSQMMDTPEPPDFGKFWKGGIEYRKYKNGKIRQTKYDPITKEELVIGQPSRKNRL